MKSTIPDLFNCQSSPARIPVKKAAWLACLMSCGASGALLADTPIGWVNSYSDTAYTTNKGDLELSLATLRVNDNIDFLDMREELLVGNRALVGKSGDLQGERISLHYGVLDYLSVFASYQQHELAADLGEISSLEVVDIDTSMDTTLWKAGFKWTLFEANLLALDDRRTALSLEAQYNRNESDSFDALVTRGNIGGFEIIFRDPQTFSVDRLADEGWSMRLRYSTALGGAIVASAWGGYGQSDASSGTSSDLTSATFARYFEQEFSQDEKYYYLGASLNTQLSARLPITLSYEFIRVSDSDYSQIPEIPPSFLPGFLTGSGQTSETSNHTLKARMSYWVTPELHVSLLGNLYANQFIGEIPHYNNSLTGSFSSLPYGFIGLELGLNVGF